MASYSGTTVNYNGFCGWVGSWVSSWFAPKPGASKPKSASQSTQSKPQSCLARGAINLYPEREQASCICERLNQDQLKKLKMEEAEASDISFGLYYKRLHGGTLTPEEIKREQQANATLKRIDNTLYGACITLINDGSHAEIPNSIAVVDIYKKEHPKEK